MGSVGESTVKMPRETVPTILNAWMPPMMKQLMDGHPVDGFGDRMSVRARTKFDVEFRD